MTGFLLFSDFSGCFSLLSLIVILSQSFLIISLILLHIAIKRVNFCRDAVGIFKVRDSWWMHRPTKGGAEVGSSTYKLPSGSAERGYHIGCIDKIFLFLKGVLPLEKYPRRDYRALMSFVENYLDLFRPTSSLQLSGSIVTDRPSPSSSLLWHCMDSLCFSHSSAGSQAHHNAHLYIPPP